MTEKRYQIFLSSTFEDLKSERQAVWQNLTDMNYIVSGMERFPSSSDEPFEYIKPLIDTSDFFVLIVGGRFGTTPDHLTTSYTEMEFDYAVSQGIPVLVFPIDEAEARSRIKSDTDPAKGQLLKAFREKTCKGRLVRSWNSESSLVSAITQSVLFEEKRKPRPGWIRDRDIDIDSILLENKTLLDRISELERANSDTADTSVQDMYESLQEKFSVIVRLKDSNEESVPVEFPLSRIIRLESVFSDPSYDSIRQSIDIVSSTQIKYAHDKNEEKEYLVNSIDVDSVLLKLRRIGVLDFDASDGKDSIRKGRNWIVAQEASRLGAS